MYLQLSQRAGSKGIVNKNLVLLGPQPLVDHTIVFAKKLSFVDNICLTSDSTDILARGKIHGVDTIHRPSNLATDTSLMIDTLIHTANTYIHKRTVKPEDLVILLLQPTSPFRSIIDGVFMFKQYVKEKHASVIEVTESREHPSETVWLDNTTGDGCFVYKDSDSTNRQDYRSSYFVTGSFYMASYISLIKHKSFFQASTFFHKTSIDFNIDIDTYNDLSLSRIILNSYPDADWVHCTK